MTTAPRAVIGRNARHPPPHHMRRVKPARHAVEIRPPVSLTAETLVGLAIVGLIRAGPGAIALLPILGRKFARLIFRLFMTVLRLMRAARFTLTWLREITGRRTTLGDRLTRLNPPLRATGALLTVLLRTGAATARERYLVAEENSVDCACDATTSSTLAQKNKIETAVRAPANRRAIADFITDLYFSVQRSQIFRIRSVWQLNNVTIYLVKIATSPLASL